MTAIRCNVGGIVPAYTLGCGVRGSRVPLDKYRGPRGQMPRGAMPKKGKIVPTPYRESPDVLMYRDGELVVMPHGWGSSD